MNDFFIYTFDFGLLLWLYILSANALQYIYAIYLFIFYPGFSWAIFPIFFFIVYRIDLLCECGSLAVLLLLFNRIVCVHQSKIILYLWENCLHFVIYDTNDDMSLQGHYLKFLCTLPNNKQIYQRHKGRRRISIYIYILNTEDKFP